MAALADIVLQIGRKPTWIDDGIVGAFGGINQRVILPVIYVQASGAMATLAVYTRHNGGVFILAAGYKFGVGVVAAHTLYLYQALETAAGTFLEAGGEVPAVFLRVKCDGRLVEVAISAEDVGIGVLAGANDVVYLLYVFVRGVFPIEAVFHDEETIPLPIRFVIVIERGIVNKCMSGEKVCGRFFFSGMAEGLPHTRLYKCLVNALIAASAAFVHTHIVCRGIINIAPEGCGFKVIIILFSPAGCCNRIQAMLWRTER